MPGAESANAGRQPVAVACLREHEHPLRGHGTPPGRAGAQRPAGSERHSRETGHHLLQRVRRPFERELSQLGAVAQADPAHTRGELAGGRSVVEGHPLSAVVATNRPRAGNDGAEFVIGAGWLCVDRHCTANLSAQHRQRPPL